jgi:F0F1-type ATP synthase assembly protein I
MENRKKQQLKSWVKYSGLAFQMLATILVCVFIGMKIDDWAGTKFPWFLILFVLFGNFSAIFWLIKGLPKE